MSEKPKQRFWQLHLSTLMLLMLIAAGLVGLNLRPYGGRIELGKGNSVEVTAANIEDGGLIGWPTAMAMMEVLSTAPQELYASGASKPSR